MEKCRFYPQILYSGQDKSHLRDFHQILGETVVFKAKSENIGKLQKWEKWENAVFTLRYWILIRMNHISVIFIKIWAIQSCLKQYPTSWESYKNGKNENMPIFVLKSWMNRIFVISIKFWVRPPCLKQNLKTLGSCENGKDEKMPISPSNIGF
jgi:hypothetical protein